MLAWIHWRIHVSLDTNKTGTANQPTASRSALLSMNVPDLTPTLSSCSISIAKVSRVAKKNGVRTWLEYVVAKLNVAVNQTT